MVLFSYTERSRDIYDFVCDGFVDGDFSGILVRHIFIFLDDETDEFFREKDLIDYNILDGWTIQHILVNFSIAENIRD